MNMTLNYAAEVAPNPNMVQNNVRACCFTPLAMQLVLI